MSVSSGIITSPVSFSDVQTALGVDHNSLDDLCKATPINKWAWYKPVSVAEIGVVTEAQRQAVHYGLSPAENAAALTLLRQDVTHSDVSAEFTAAKNAMREWTYTRPSGGVNSPYRLTDFVENPAAGRGDNGGFTNIGYKHDTRPPIVFGTTWEVGIERMQNVADNIIVVVSSASDSAWTADPYTNSGSGNIDSGQAQRGSYCYEGLRYENYAARFGAQSEQNLNMNDSYVIPVNYILNSSVFDAGWRFGIVVFVPGISGNNVIPYDTAGIFLSRYPLSAFSGNVAEKIQKFSVDMCTNQVLARQIATYVNAKGTTTFDCLPVFAKVGMGSIQGGGEYARTYQALSGANSTFYSLPTGDKEFKLTVKASEQPTPSGNESKTTGNWTLKMLYTGQMTGNSSTPSAQRYPINNLVIVWTGSGAPVSGRSYQFAYDFDWSSYDGSNHSGTMQNDSVAYTGGNTITVNGTSYYGFSIMGAPNVTMNLIRTFTVS